MHEITYKPILFLRFVRRSILVFLLNVTTSQGTRLNFYSRLESLFTDLRLDRFDWQ